MRFPPGLLPVRHEPAQVYDVDLPFHFLLPGKLDLIKSLLTDQKFDACVNLLHGEMHRQLDQQIKDNCLYCSHKRTDAVKACEPYTTNRDINYRITSAMAGNLLERNQDILNKQQLQTLALNYFECFSVTNAKYYWNAKVWLRAFIECYEVQLTAQFDSMGHRESYELVMESLRHVKANLRDFERHERDPADAVVQYRNFLRDTLDYMKDRAYLNTHLPNKPKLQRIVKPATTGTPFDGCDFRLRQLHVIIWQYYEGKPVTSANVDEVAAKYGWKSKTLVQKTEDEWTPLLEPADPSRRKLTTRKNRIREVLPYLSKQAAKRAERDLKLLTPKKWNV